MADFHWKLILIAIILNCSFSQSLANQPTETQDGQAHTSGRTEDIGLADAEDCGDSGECEDLEQLFSENLQNNYLDGFLQIQKFFKSTNSVLEKINDRLGRLENSDGEIKQKLGRLENSDGEIKQKLGRLENSDGEIKQKLGRLENSDGEIKQKLGRLENYNSRYDSSLNRLDTEYYLNSLSPPAKGASFNGLTTEQIAAAIPGNGALAVQIENFLDVELTDYQLYLYTGLEHQKAPTIVSPKSSEIFTFKDNGHYPEGVFLYRIGNSGFSIHLFFEFAWRFAAAILENKASVRTLWPIINGCSSFTHTETQGTLLCISYYTTWNTTKTFVLHKDSVYAKLTIHYKEKTTTVKIEVFKFER